MGHAVVFHGRHRKHGIAIENGRERSRTVFEEMLTRDLNKTKLLSLSDVLLVQGRLSETVRQNFMMKTEIQKHCDSWSRILDSVLTKDYSGQWTDEYELLFRETVRKIVLNLNFVYRRDPAFQLKADLSNLMEDGYQPGTEQFGSEIAKIVRSRFETFKAERRMKNEPTQ